MKNLPPFSKGGLGGILRINVVRDYEISPFPSFPKRGIFGSIE
jgi:hypothetical protein